MNKGIQHTTNNYNYGLNLTKLEYFAGQALKTYVVLEMKTKKDVEKVAKLACDTAEAMIKELERRSNGS